MRTLKELLQECADMNRWKIEELNIQKDHVHMLVQMNPDVAVCKMVQLFKGSSSKAIREEFPELKEFLWGNSFWAKAFKSHPLNQSTAEPSYLAGPLKPPR